MGLSAQDSIKADIPSTYHVPGPVPTFLQSFLGLYIMYQQNISITFGSNCSEF